MIDNRKRLENDWRTIGKRSEKNGLQPELGVGVCCKWIVGDRLYAYVCRLSIHHYGGGLRPPPQQWGGRIRRPPHCCGLHNGWWKGGKHSHTTYPPRFTYNISYINIYIYIYIYIYMYIYISITLGLLVVCFVLLFVLTSFWILARQIFVNHVFCRYVIWYHTHIWKFHCTTFPTRDTFLLWVGVNKLEVVGSTWLNHKSIYFTVPTMSFRFLQFVFLNRL